MNPEKFQPPRLAGKILKRIFAGIGGTSEADFEEVFRLIAAERGKFIARWWYRLQVLISVWSYIIGKIYWSGTMFSNYLKIAIRNIQRQKIFSIINITGLAIGLTICILIFLFVDYELGFDSHVADREKIYRVVTHTHRPEGTEYDGATPFPTAEAFRIEFSELMNVTQFFVDGDIMITVGEHRFKTDNLYFVEEAFLELLGSKWILGDRTKALDDPNAVVLTERLAGMYFGGRDVLGRTLLLDNEMELHVTGVVADPPRRTSHPYVMLISWGTMDAHYTSGVDQWGFMNSASQTFLKLPETVAPQDLEARFDALEKKYMEPEYAEKWSFRLQPLSDIHFDPRYDSMNYVTSRTVLFVFSGIGCLILIIACINFINLTTAQAMKRAGEVGMRKVLGADRAQLVRQLLGETSLFTLLSLLIALLLAWSVLPYLNQFLGNNINLSLTLDGGVLIFLCSVYLTVSFLNGLYPAFVLSRYQPAEALKIRRASSGKQSYTMRNSLVLVQFVISQVLIVGTLIIASQIKYMSDFDVGFKREGIITVGIPDYEEARCEALRSQWMQNPRIQDVSFAWSAPTSQSNFGTPCVYEASGSLTEWPVFIKMCDKHYLDVYEIPLIAGRYFERNSNDESNKQYVVNEGLVDKMGLMNPEDAIGKIINVNDQDGVIIGVLRDFHTRSLHSEVIPTVFFNYWPGNFDEAQFKVEMTDVQQTLAHIRGIWTENFPEYVFEYSFLDDYLNSLYDSESKLLIMIQSVSILAILIGCLGLLGLVSFMVVQRTKEIGIRKVLGASISNIYIIVSKDFLKWVILACVLAWPAAYFLASKWLQEFAYRIRIGTGYFLLGGLLSFGIAVLVVTYQVVRAARANPVEAIKYE